MKTYLKRYAAIFITVIMIFALFPHVNVRADSLPKYSFTDSKELSFNPADSVLDDTQPVVYLTDMVNKRVVAYNYITNQSRYIQFNLQPEHITIAQNQLYVTLLSSNHNPRDYTMQPGAVAVIDTDAFDAQVPTAKVQFSIDIEPYGITVDNQGYIYITGITTNYGAKIESYEPKSQKEVSSQLNSKPGKLIFNSYNNTIYNTGYVGIGNNQIYLNVAAYPVNNGIIGNKYDYTDYDIFDKNEDLMLSPDGKFLYTSAYEVLTCSKDMGGELLKYKKSSINIGYNGMAVNMDDRVVYGGHNIYDYDSFMIIGSYTTKNPMISKSFYKSNKLIALTTDFNGKPYIETMDTTPIIKAPFLVSTSIDDGDMNLPLINEVTLNFNQDINILSPYIVEVTGPQNDMMKVTPTVQGNKLNIKFNSSLDYNQAYNISIRGGYGCITGKTSGIEYPDNIYLTFTTGSKDSINEGIKHYIGSNKWIDGEKTYEGDLFVGLNNNTLVVNPNSKLTVNGDLIAYGNIVNYGTINVTGNIYIRNKSVLYPYTRQGFIGNLDNEGTITGNVVTNSYPKPFMILTPNTDTTQVKSKQTFQVMTYPGFSALLNGQIYQEKTGMVTNIPYQLRSGNNDVKIGVEDILHNKNEKEININCILPAPKLIGMSPDNLESVPMPINPKIVLKFDQPLDNFATSNVVTLTNNKTKVSQNIHAQVKSDENGINNELMIGLGYGILPALTNFTLNIPYQYVISEDGVGLDKDYSITFSTDGGVKRLAGQDRYSTSVEISKEGWDTANNVILATGDSFPDALCAAPLARMYNAPILLTNSKSLNTQVFDEIKRLRAQNIYIIGGTGAVSKDIENTLTSNGLMCTRIQGKDRYETSAAIANKVGERGTFIVATGNDFPDALSIAPLAAQIQAPILLTDKNNLSTSIKAFIDSHSNRMYNNPKTIVVGGSGVISDNVLNFLPNAQRFGGSNRYDTNYKINSGINMYNYSATYDWTHVFFATGSDFPDALAGSILAGYMNTRIILVGKDMNLKDVDTKNFLKQYASTALMKYVLGGTGPVPQNVVDNIINLK